MCSTHLESATGQKIIAPKDQDAVLAALEKMQISGFKLRSNNQTQEEAVLKKNKSRKQRQKKKRYKNKQAEENKIIEETAQLLNKLEIRFNQIPRELEISDDKIKKQFQETAEAITRLKDYFKTKI